MNHPGDQQTAGRISYARTRAEQDSTITPAVLNDIDAAAYLGITKYWLRNNRRSPAAPPFVKIGGRIKYRIESLDTWLLQQEVVN